MPQKTWVVGEEVLAADFNTYVQNQVVPRFASVAARDAAWPAATAGLGAFCVTTDGGPLWTVTTVSGAPLWVPVTRRSWRVKATAPTANANNTNPITCGLIQTIQAVAGFSYRIDSTHQMTTPSGAVAPAAAVLHYIGTNVNIAQLAVGGIGQYSTAVVTSYFVAATTGPVNVEVFFYNPAGTALIQDYATGAAQRYSFVTELGP